MVVTFHGATVHGVTVHGVTVTAVTFHDATVHGVRVQRSIFFATDNQARLLEKLICSYSNLDICNINGRSTLQCRFHLFFFLFKIIFSI
jgi:hypothetical protein